MAQDTRDKLDTRLTQVNIDKVDMTQVRNKLRIHWQVDTLDADKLIDTSLVNKVRHKLKISYGQYTDRVRHKYTVATRGCVSSGRRAPCGWVRLTLEQTNGDIYKSS